MSFFKKFKDRLHAPSAKISLQIPQTSYFLGDNLEGTFSIMSEEEFDAKEIRCEFQCVETKKRIVPQYDASLKRNVLKEVMDSATLWSSRPVINGPTHMANGLAQNFPLSINIPLSGRATFHSVEQNIVWSLKGVIAVEDRPDVTSSIIEIQVSPPIAAPRTKEKQIVMIPCKYCGSLMAETETVCSNCGARRTA